MKEQQQTFRETQEKIDQLQEKIEQLQLKRLFSTTLSDKGTATVNESGSLVISKGSKFTYCGYLIEHYDLKDGPCYRFILDDRLTESILVDYDQAKNLKAFIKKLGNFFAKYEGYNTDYTYNNYLSRLNLSRLYKDIDIKALDAKLKLMKKLKAAGFKVANF